MVLGKKRVRGHSKFCPQCGTKNNLHDSYCISCGYSFHKKPRKKRKFSSKNIIVYILILIVLYLIVRSFLELSLIPSSVSDAFNFTGNFKK